MSAIAPSLEEEEPTTLESSARVVWALAWPAVALNSLQVVNTMLDRGFIGRLEQAALTAHGGATNVLFMMFSLAIAIATGATALVSRGYGANDPTMYRRAAKESVGIAIFGGFLLAIITALTASWCSHLILPQRDHTAIKLMTTFVIAYSAGMPAIYVIQTLAGCLRGIGDTVSPMWISGIQILMHITLNFILVLPDHDIFGWHVPGFGLGLVGAGIALSTSAWVAAVIYMAWAGRTPLGEQLRVKMPDLVWVRRILRVAVPAAMMATLRVLSLTAFTIILSLTPQASQAIAGMSVSFAVEALMIMPAFGLGAAAGALVGQSLGMRKPERAERLGWVAAHHGGLVTVILAVPVFLLSPWMVSALVPGKPEVMSEAVLLLRYISISEFLFAYAMILIGAMQGAGDTRRPMWISLFALWGLRVPLAFIFALAPGTAIYAGFILPFGLGLGASGAWISMATTQGLQGFLAMYLWKQGAWKTMKV